eukprot:1663120-Rhodomonas_salina.1
MPAGKKEKREAGSKVRRRAVTLLGALRRESLLPSWHTSNCQHHSIAARLVTAMRVITQHQRPS